MPLCGETSMGKSLIVEEDDMRYRTLVTIFMLSLGVLAATCPASAAIEKGQPVPSFRAVDIRNQEVDLDKIVAGKPDLVVLFFFTSGTGEEIAVKLRRLDLIYGGEKNKLRIVAIGCRSERAALEKFASDLAIQFYIVNDTPEIAVEGKYGPLTSLPYTFLITSQKILLESLGGSGEAKADLINDIAQAYLQMNKPEETKTLADEAIRAGENATEAGSLKGFALTAEGKLDEAQAEFGKIDSKEGLAKVALERGQYDEASRLADQAGADNGYAQTVKGTALMRSGKIEDAATTLETAAQKPAADWQKAEALNSLGRVQQTQGKTDAAISSYQQAVAINPVDVVALSNEGAAYREKGDLKKAAEVLEKAQTVRDDDLVAVMLEQVRKELKEATDVKRGELIRAQIADLRARYEALKAAGKDKPVDEWTSPPLVLAFLPSTSAATTVLDRAGMDIALRREVESRLQASGSVQVVEREVLDKLLQELQLGASELASQDTQLQLGKVLSARMLGFIDFGRIGPDTMVYTRFVDTETTSLAAQMTRSLNAFPNLPALVDDLVREILQKVSDGRQLKGLVADAPSEDGIIINLGKRHGLKQGTRFNVVVPGAPIEAGGKVLGHRESKVALIEVTQVEDLYAVCKMLSKNEGVTIAKDMKVSQAKS